MNNKRVRSRGESEHSEGEDSQESRSISQEYDDEEEGGNYDYEDVQMPHSGTKRSKGLEEFQTPRVGGQTNPNTSISSPPFLPLNQDGVRTSENPQSLGKQTFILHESPLEIIQEEDQGEALRHGESNNAVAPSPGPGMQKHLALLQNKLNEKEQMEGAKELIFNKISAKLHNQVADGFIVEAEKKEAVQEQQNIEEKQEESDSSSDSDPQVPDDKEQIDEIMEIRDQQQEGTLFSLIFMILFIVHFILEVQVTPATGIITILNISVFNQRQNYSAFSYVGGILNVTNEEQLQQSTLFLFEELFSDQPFDYTTIEEVNYYVQNTTNTDQSILGSSRRVLQNNSSTGADSTGSTADANQSPSSPSQEGPPLYGVMVRKYTYFAGLRITTNNPQLEENQNSKDDQILDTYRTQIYNTISDPINGNYVNQSMPPWTYRANDGYLQEGGFIEYFKGNTSYTDATTYLQYMIDNNWFQNNMFQTAIECMFYNKNTKIGIVMILKFFKSNSGQFFVAQDSKVFLPQNYEDFGTYTIIKLCLFVGSSLGVTFLLLKIIISLIMTFKQFFVQRTLIIEWYTYVDISVVCLCMTSIVLWFQTFISTRNKFSLPMENEDDFSYWVQLSYQFRTYLRVSSMCIVLMCIRNLRVLTTQFPAFGVLFDTIRKAKRDLLYFFLFVFTLALAAVTLSMGFFGQYDLRFSTMFNTIMTLFQMMFGINFYNELEASNSTLAPIFFYPFNIIFFFIVLSFFSVIMMRTYDMLRKEKQLVTESMALILAAEASKQKTIWFNLLCCKMPQAKPAGEEENEFAYEPSSSEDDESKTPSMNKKKKKKKKPTESKEQEAGFKNFLGDDDGGDDKEKDTDLQTKILYNLSQIKKFVRGNQFRTREQFEDQLHRAQVLILRRKKRELEKRKEIFVNSASKQNYEMLKESVIYLFYIIVFVVMISYQTNNLTSQMAGQPISQYLANKPFPQILASVSNGVLSSNATITFSEIEDSSDMLDYLKQNIVPFIYDSASLEEQCNFGIGQYYIRLTFRFVNNSVNLDNKTNKFFVGHHNTYSLGLTSYSADSYYEIMDPQYDVDGILLNYTEPGDPTTSYNGLGGYIVNIDSDPTISAHTIKGIYPIDWLYHGLSIFAVEFVLYNPNYNKYLYNQVVFEIDGAGFVTPVTGTNVLYMNHFTKANAWLIILEIVYVFFNMFYIYKLTLALIQIWKKISKNEVITYPARASKFEKVVLYIGIDYQQFEKKSIVIIVFRIILGLVIFLIRLSIKLFKVIFIRVTKSVFAFIDVVQLVLSTQIIVVWCIIIAQPAFSLDEDGNEPEVISSSNQLYNDQVYYRTLCHFNAFITFLRILQFFTFSKKLSSFSEVISSAKYDILFFILMFAFIIFGYSVSAYGLFGGAVSEFKSMQYSALYLLRALLLDFDYSILYNADSTISAVFFVSYLVIFKIGLINMFIAIIVAHYNQFNREREDDPSTKNANFFTVIWNIVRQNMFKSEDKKQDEAPAKKCCDIKKLNEYLFGTPNIQAQKQNEDMQTQEQEMQKTKSALSTRVSKPALRDYKIHYGMKSYFHEDQQTDKAQGLIQKDFSTAGDLMLGNAGIYKRAEQQGYQEHDFNNANFWVYNLEENLSKQTNKKVSLYDFHADESIFTDEVENLDPNQLTQFQQEFLMIDKKLNPEKRLKYFLEKAAASIYQKYALWKAMDFEKQIRIVAKDDKDLGISILRSFFDRQHQDGSVSACAYESLNMQYKLLSKSQIYSEEFNRVTKLQHYIWTQILEADDQYMLWFHIFKVQDRVRLWNTLVFSENYFNYVAFTHKYQRSDIRRKMAELKAKIDKKIAKQESKLAERLKMKAKRRKPEGEQKKTELSLQEKLRIRDKFYNSKFMLELWDLLKKRKFEIVVGKSKENGEPITETVVLSQHVFTEMINSVFKIMVCGISNSITKLVQKFQNEKVNKSTRIHLFKELKESMFDKSEYRLSLWLPLTKEEKLDMMLHQRIDNEMDIMMFLLDQEYDLSINIGNSDRLDLNLERSFDTQVFSKYQQYSRYQALKNSLELCQKRLKEVQEEDRQILEYIAFLREKQEEYEGVITQMKGEVYRTQKRNEKLSQNIMDAQKTIKEARYQTQALKRKTGARGAYSSVAGDDDAGDGSVMSKHQSKTPIKSSIGKALMRKIGRASQSKASSAGIKEIEPHKEHSMEELEQSDDEGGYMAPSDSPDGKLGKVKRD